MSDFFIVRRGGAGGAGATLTVNAPNGVTAKLRQGDVIKTKVVANGSAVFPGLSGGQWLVSIYDSTHTETTPQPVTVTTDYTVTLSYFSATINITYPAGSTCTVTSSNGAITLTAPDTSGVWICTVPEADIWTVAIQGTPFSEAVTISSNGQTINITIGFSRTLYKNGVENVPIYVQTELNTTTKTDTCIKSENNQAKLIYINNDSPIDFTPYAKAKIRCMVSYIRSSSFPPKFYVLDKEFSDRNTAITNHNNTYNSSSFFGTGATVVESAAFDEKIIEIPIENLNYSGYVGITGMWNGEVYEIVLEA